MASDSQRRAGVATRAQRPRPINHHGDVEQQGTICGGRRRNTETGEWFQAEHAYLVRAAECVISAASAALLWAGPDNHSVLAKVAGADPDRMVLTRISARLHAKHVRELPDLGTGIRLDNWSEFATRSGPIHQGDGSSPALPDPTLEPQSAVNGRDVAQKPIISSRNCPPR